MLSLGIGNREVSLTLRQWFKHLLIYAVTGGGKSKLLESIIFQLFMLRMSFLAADSDGKTVRDFYARVAELVESPSDRYRVVLLQASPDLTFSYDPFYTTLTGAAYDGWLARKCKSVGRSIGRPSGLADYKEQPRRDRWLTNVCYFVGTNVSGRHWGLDHAYDALECGTMRHPSAAWNRVFGKLKDHLPVEVQRDFERLKRMSLHDQEMQIESTRNILRTFLTEPMKKVVRPGKPSFDWRRAIRQGMAVLIDAEETPFTSREEQSAFASLMINEFEEAAFFEKKPCGLILEEMATVLGDDIGGLLKRARKYVMGVCGCLPGIYALENRFTDLRGDSFIAGTHITGQVKDPETLEAMAKLHGLPMLDFTLDWRPMDRPDGHEWHKVQDKSKSTTRGGMVVNGNSLVHTNGQTDSASTGNQIGNNWQTGNNWGNQITHSSDTSRQHGGTSRLREGLILDEGASETEGTREGRSAGKNVGGNQSAGGQQSFTEQLAFAFLNSIANGQMQSSGLSASDSESVSERLVPLQRYKTEWHPNGLLLPLDVQYAVMEKILRMLSVGQFVISTENHPTLLFRAHYVPDPFEGRPKRLEYEVSRLKQWMIEKHAFFTYVGSPSISKPSSP